MKRKAPEIRAAAVHAVQLGKLSLQDALSVFHVSKSSLYRWMKIYKEEGRIIHKTPTGRTPVLTEEHIEQIKKIMAEQPDITLTELAERLDHPACIATIHDHLKKLGYGYKKNTQGVRTRPGRCETCTDGMERHAAVGFYAPNRMHR